MRPTSRDPNRPSRLVRLAVLALLFALVAGGIGWVIGLPPVVHGLLIVAAAGAAIWLADMSFGRAPRTGERTRP